MRSLAQKDRPVAGLMELITKRQARVAVIGLGYVGLPLAVRLAEAGFTVSGFDVNEDRRQMIDSGISYLADVTSEEISAVTSAGKLEPAADYSALREMDVVIVCVPTPITKMKTPDLSFVEAATEQVAAHLRRGQLVILESTTYPGTTEEMVLPILEAEGFEVGQDFFLCFSPERIDPGNGVYKIANTPKIVGGVTESCGELAARLYGAVAGRVVVVSSPKVAETAKLFENVFRNVNIALVNELLVLCEKMGISVWEVIDTAATKPFGFMRFDPGPGVGGHCIPVDPYYLAAKAKEYDIHSHFIELAGQVNANMPAYVVKRINQALNEKERPIKESRVLVLGVSYKRNVSDTRGSPGLKIIRQLREAGAVVTYHDPLVDCLEHEQLVSEPLTPATLADQDLVVLMCNHGDLDLPLVLEYSRLILDTRNAVDVDGPDAGRIIKL